MAQSNYGGKQPDQSAYIKRFEIDRTNYTWNYATVNNQLLLTPTNKKATVYIDGNLFVGGTITNPSDINLKDNIENLSLSLTLSEKIMSLNPVKYNYKDDEKKEHFGLIAQDVEKLFPNLVNTISTPIGEEEVSFKTVNYLEIIPLLLLKIKDLQNQIDSLNKKHGEENESFIRNFREIRNNISDIYKKHDN
jgi:hypothetical protein